MAGCIQKLASFPNTRQRPRKPTQRSRTYTRIAYDPSTVGPTVIEVNDPDEIIESQETFMTTKGNTILKAYTQDRTYLTLRNVHPSDPMVYGYTDDINLKNGANNTYKGMILNAGDSVDIDSPETLFGRGLNGSDVECRIDQGIG